MTDYFALLELPRSPWIEPAHVREAFVRLSTPVHPDRVHQADEITRLSANQKYADYNAACRCLVETPTRLRHLLDLAAVQKRSDVGSAPSGISDLFFSVGANLRKADELVRQQSDAPSPMIRARLMQKSIPIVAELRTLHSGLAWRESELDRRCRVLTRDWSAAPQQLDTLAEMLREYAFIKRWMGQLRERELQLVL